MTWFFCYAVPYAEKKILCAFGDDLTKNNYCFHMFSLSFIPAFTRGETSQARLLEDEMPLSRSCHSQTAMKNPVKFGSNTKTGQIVYHVM